MLAGIGVQAAWRTRRRGLSAVGLLVAAIGAVYVIASSWWVNAERRADPRELLVSTQTSEAVLRVRDRILRLERSARRVHGRPLTVTVDTAQGATFPWAWYLRRLEGVGYVDLSQVAAAPPRTDVVIATEESRRQLGVQLAGYEEDLFEFRVWWVRDYRRLDPGSALEWIVRREPWNPTGAMYERLLVRPL